MGGRRRGWQGTERLDAYPALASPGWSALLGHPARMMGIQPFTVCTQLSAPCPHWPDSGWAGSEAPADSGEKLGSDLAQVAQLIDLFQIVFS